jgi:hypothetical protein
MSIEMENPVTILEKVDTLTNLVEQMLMAHRMRDEQRFNDLHERASKIGYELLTAMNEAQDPS